jgi:hypothetical protein
MDINQEHSGTSGYIRDKLEHRDINQEYSGTPGSKSWKKSLEHRYTHIGMYWNTVTNKEYTGTQEYTFVVDWKTGTIIRDLQGTGHKSGIYWEHRNLHQGYTGRHRHTSGIYWDTGTY